MALLVVLMQQNKSGFTIIELLIVIAIMTIIGAVFLPVSIDYQQRNDLDVAQTTFAQSIRRAQQMSMSGEGDSQWGVNMITGNIVIFKGSTYAGRDTTFDENYSISTSITNSGQTEYDFSKTTGTPAQVGAVTFVNGNYQKTVSVNAYGVVNY
jgi:prepilin-type N-terminal cleavage/methylation domain-containing protein